MEKSSLYTIIKSKNRVKLLTLFLTNPDERYYYTEIFKRLSIPHAILQRELKGFTGIGLVLNTREANISYYFINKEFPIYQELKSIIFKTVGLADYLRESLKKIGNIHAAFIYGSVAKNLEDITSDIDLMVIGDVDMDSLHDAVSKAEDALGREINFTTFDISEWKKRVAKKQSFVMDVIKNPKIFLIGDENDIRKRSSGNCRVCGSLLQ
jgi:predicted nucleotidyltransferase